MLARAYRFLRELHRDGRTDFYTTTIVADNAKVRDILTSGRCGLPTYQDIGCFHTLAMAPTDGRCAPCRGVSRERGAPETAEELTTFLHRQGRRRQFYPCLRAADLIAPGAQLRGLRIQDFRILRRGGRIVATAAAWDQTAFKQTWITGYSGALALVRPLASRAARVLGYPALPAAPAQLRYLYVSFLAVDADDPTLCDSLLQWIASEARDEGCDCLLAGFHEHDPLLRVAAARRHVTYTSRLCLVYWEDGADAAGALDARVPYLELATL
jgi:hypothetical protein